MQKQVQTQYNRNERCQFDDSLMTRSRSHNSIGTVITIVC